MTYLERITYLTGRFLEVFQYTLFNAYRFATFFDGIKSLSPQTNTEENIEALESVARTKLVESQGKDVASLEKDLLGHGLSVKDEKELHAMLLKRNYIVSYFFLNTASDLAKEDPRIYENTIDELQEYVDRAIDLNTRISNAFGRILERDYRHFGK